MHVVITMPVYNDWESAVEVCQRIDLVFRERKSFRVSILLVDDGSNIGTSYPQEIPFQPQAVQHISILELQRNVGHQRAIAIGLTYLQEHWKGDAVVVMDADGEDRPEDIPALVKAMTRTENLTAVFAERGKRLENAAFRVFYHCYRLSHLLLTGRDIRFGNFSALPWRELRSLVVFPELWNHYAATFLKSRLPYVRVRSERARRLKGKSQMNFVGLVVHGLSALFANQDVVGTRLLVLNLVITLFLLLLIGMVVGLRLLTGLAIPGWATTTVGLLLVLVAQSLVASCTLVFLIMMNRSHLGFLPIRDYSYFVFRETVLYSR